MSVRVAGAAAMTLLLAAPARAATMEELAEDVRTRLERVDRPGAPLPPSRAVVDRRELLPRDPERPPSFRVFRDLQVRRAGRASSVFGSDLPVDSVTGVLPGTLLAMRVGAHFRGLGAYALFGGGTFTAYRHVFPSREREPMQVLTSSTPFGFIGLGGEVQLYRGFVFAAEVNWGTVLTHHGQRHVVAPDPTDVVRTAVCALRVRY